MKTCARCSAEKPLTEFKTKKGGKYHPWCNPCSKEYAKNFARTPDQQAKRRSWYQENKQKISARSKDRWASNKALYEPARQKWAAENRDKMLAYTQERGHGFREWVDSMKAGKPCLDCSRTFPPYIMEYVHGRGEKRHNIGKMANHKPERVLEEIAKCDLVCCACHRIRSHSRRKSPTTKKLIEFREWVNLLKAHPCTDCKRILAPVAMDFDHVQGDKVEGIAQMWSWGREKVLAELAKCELVCANCHRERTVTRLRSGIRSRTSPAFLPITTQSEGPVTGLEAI
jgi:hypothetical protein